MIFVEAKADPSLSQELKVLNNQGIVQYFSEDYSKALMIIKKMPNIEIKNKALSYGIVAYTYKTIGNYPKALEYAQKSLMIHKKNIL